MPKLTSFPEFDSSSSTTLGDDRRVVLMKGAVLSELVQQPCIFKAFALFAVTVSTLSPQTPETIARTLGPDAVQLARDIGLPYAWVAQGLLHGFVAGIEAIAAGQEIQLPLPRITLTHDPMQKRPAGRRPDEAALVRYAQWYVSHHVGGISMNALARKYHDTHQKKPHNLDHTWLDDRKTVSDGIKEVDRLLKLTR